MDLSLLKKQLFYGLVFAFLAQVIGISKATSQGTTPFKTTWIATGGSITIPTSNTSGTYSYTINYRKKGTTPFTIITAQTGDYTISSLTATDTIQVEITGLFPHFYMNNNSSERSKLLSIDAWGNQVWKSMQNAFQGCSNLTYSATDVPDLSLVTNMSTMFANCSKFNGNIGGWNTSNVTDMSLMFNGASAFNQNIGSWNTGKVTLMGQMFQNAGTFNQDISGWQTTAVTSMSQMFSGATSFNQPIGLWNTGMVNDMSQMFSGATSFNQPIGLWNTGKVINMTEMFANATAFNQNIGKWDMRGVSNGGNAPNMLKNIGMNCTNYSATLYGWANNATPAMGVNLGDVSTNGVNRQYSMNAVSARTTLTNTVANGGKYWTITGDAAAADICDFGPPAPTASAQSYCQGKTVADLTTTSGQNIQWYATATGGTALATTTTLATANYYATQTVGGIESARTSVSVTVNPPTTATVTLSPTTICAGTSGSITPTVTNGGSSYSYVWRINSVTQTTTSPTINYSTATGNDEYSLTVTPLADACPFQAFVIASVRIMSLTVPKVYISPAIVCENTNTTLGVTSSLGNLGTAPSYVWKRNNANLATSSTISVTNAVLADTYAVTVTLSPDAGCYTTYTATSSLIVGCILSITSGNWEDPATWNLNRAPLTTDNAVINNNHNVTINTDSASSNKAEVRPNAKLIYGNSAAKLKVGF